MNILHAQILTRKYHFPIQKSWSSLAKWLIPGLGQGKYKISLEHLVGQKVKKGWKMDQRQDFRANLMALPVAKSGAI